jgi:hypothetical protein
MFDGSHINQDYDAFIKRKVRLAGTDGFDIADSEINPVLKPHQRAAVRWALAGGRRALFESFGLGKSIQQLELLRIIVERLDDEDRSKRHRAIIVAPLGVKQEFQRDAIEILGWYESPKFIKRSEHITCDQCNGSGEIENEACANCEGTGTEAGLFITNYESIREEKIDLTLFDAISLDEASVLRSFGSKTFSEFLFGAVQKVRYRFVATATPSPNEFQELLAYSHFLGVMDIGQARTRFFKRNSEKSDDLTLHPHKEREFWLWVASWALFLQKPSDLGFSDEGYDLPDINVHFHEVAVDHLKAAPDKFGQSQLFRSASAGVSEAAREKRDTLDIRVAKMRDIVAAECDEHWLLWHDLEAERHAIAGAVPDAVSVYGSQDLDEREQAIIDFSDGKFKYLSAKPVIAGSGCNFQRHCSRAIFVGIGFKFNDFIQAIHRIHRFLQTRAVDIHIIYAESEKLILERLMEKWERDKQQRAVMADIIREYGLSHEALNSEITRGFGVERREISGEMYSCILNDSVEEMRDRERHPDNSIGLMLTSIPFATQYEYSPNYNDFGHTDDNEHFFAQMDFLTPELFRVLKPGRIAAVHVKDRIVPSAMTGLGFQVVYEFHCDVIRHFRKHGFAYMGMKTIVTDVVRENNQTYRLGWTEQCKDGTKMGCGMPEYLLLFRKPPTETQNSYADMPVVKSKEEYTRGRWQIDAHGFMRLSGDRFLMPEEWKDLPWNVIWKLFKQRSLSDVYDYEAHVKLAETLDDNSRLPVDFMLLPPQSWHPDVWTDITRMRTLNSSQAQKGKQVHLCPLQFDLVDRVIKQMSMPGETVLDPFAGLMTVPYRAVKFGRRGIGIELNTNYFLDGAAYCEAMEQQSSAPSLFDLLECETPAEIAA